MRTLNGHFDGKHIVLDEPVELKPNTRVKIIAVESGATDAEVDEEIIRGCERLSEATFQKIWDNPLDADYDKL
jgi:hypothetical protein